MRRNCAFQYRVLIELFIKLKSTIVISVESDGDAIDILSFKIV